MDYEEYYETQSGGGGGRGGGIPRVFVGSPYQRGHGIGSFLGGLFRKILPYLRSGARAVGKEALRAGINVMEDVENDTPLKESIKNRFMESRKNLKRKAEEKIKDLMKGSGYKVSAKSAALQFPVGCRVPHFGKRTSLCKRKRTVKRKSKNSVRKKSVKRLTTKKKKSRGVARKTKKSSVTKRRSSKKRTVSDIFA